MKDPLPPSSSKTYTSGTEESKSDSNNPNPTATLSKRVFGWTCNILATALVLFAGIAFAQQILHWWHGDAAQARAARATAQVLGSGALTTPGMPIDLEVGDWPCSLRREEFSGDRAAAQKELRRLCQASLVQANLPLPPAGPAELKLLAGLERQTPFAVMPGGWQLYEMDGPVPLVAAVRNIANTPPQQQPANSRLSPNRANSTDLELLPTAAGEVAPVARRVVSWGLGIHLAGTRWTLLLLTAQDQAPIGDLRWAMPLPPGAKRVLSLSVSEDSTIVAFAGQGSLESWQKMYDDLHSTGATQQGWRQVGDVWQQRYEQSLSTTDVSLAPVAGSKEIRGLLTIQKKLLDGTPGE